MSIDGGQRVINIINQVSTACHAMTSQWALPFDRSNQSSPISLGILISPEGR